MYALFGTAGFAQILVVLIFLTSFSVVSNAALDTFDPLKVRLIDDGFSPRHVYRVYGPGVSPHYKTVANSLRRRESKLNYAQFLSNSSVSQAERFLRQYEPIFLEAQMRYGVEPYIIAAILLVETRMGQYTGNTPTLAVLSTFAIMDQKRHRDIIWSKMSAKDRKRWGRSAFDKKLMKRSKWAYAEVTALLRISDKRPEKAATLKGSVMGAIGWPQFLPSSLLSYGVDGNKDGVIDLFHPTDAIFSVANYLKGYGWLRAKNRTQKEKVIWHYNHSRPYVLTIMELADRLRLRSPVAYSRSKK
jgi:membrane-bound lytic murein transglycosylase B